MELRQLGYFDAVVRHGSFTKAARRLHVAQPAVSAQIKRLEAELGATLLERTTRRVALTQAGELFLARARQVLAQLDGARTDLAELSAVLRGQVRIGATQVLGSLDLPAALAQFRRRYPGVSLALYTGLIAKLLGLLDSGQVDLVVGPVHDDLPAGYHARPLAAESLVLVTPLGHPLAAGRGAALAAAREEPFVCLPADSGLRAILTGAAAAEGFVPRVEFETYSPASIRELVSAGLGVALLARSAAETAGPPIGICGLARAPEHPPIGLIRSRARPLAPAPRAFAEHLAGAAGQAAGRAGEARRPTCDD
ncbi:MAG TPA: LysR family transcriptional regulator [Streptosporangiaceae bacterium]|nr:LysR family transcriptional regulator [Streptosporangiaceae bacterium]